MLIKLDIGTDVSEITKTKKYDPEALKEQKSMDMNTNKSYLLKFFMKFSLFRKFYYWFNPHVPRSFPVEYIQKTDQERIQSEPYKLRKYEGHICYMTEKLDGCSATYILVKNKKKLPFLSKYEYMVCSRNFRVDKTGHNQWAEMSQKYNIENILKYLIENEEYLENIQVLKKNQNEYIISMAIQGEIIGPGIQQNKYKLNEREFKIFNIEIQTNISKYKLNYHQIRTICRHNNLCPVDIIVFENSKNLTQPLSIDDTIEKWLKRSSFKTRQPSSDINAEGIVVSILGNTETNKQFVIDSFKVINPEFLLKYSDEE